MAIINGRTNPFHKQKIDVGTVMFENIGDAIRVKLKKKSLSSETYAKRHFVVSGRFKVSYPGTDYQDYFAGPGVIWPTSSVNVDVSEFVVTAVEPNSSYHCFITSNERKVVHDSVPVTKGQELALEPGEIYASSVPFTIGDKVGSVGTVMCFNEQGKVFVAQEEGELIIARSVPCNDSNTTTDILRL